MDVFEPLKNLNLEIVILDSLLRQWNVFEDFNVLNFNKILLTFAIVFKMFECFCPFLSLTIITGQRSFSSLADELLDITQEKKTVLNIFTAKSGSFLFKFSISANFWLMICFLIKLEN